MKNKDLYIYPVGEIGKDYSFGKLIKVLVPGGDYRTQRVVYMFETYENALNKREVIEVVTVCDLGLDEIAYKETFRRRKSFKELYPNLPLILLVIALSTQVCSILMQLFLL